MSGMHNALSLRCGDIGLVKIALADFLGYCSTSRDSCMFSILQEACINELLVLTAGALVGL